jgi:hypothetical protein
MVNFSSFQKKNFTTVKFRNVVKQCEKKKTHTHTNHMACNYFQNPKPWKSEEVIILSRKPYLNYGIKKLA